MISKIFIYVFLCIHISACTSYGKGVQSHIYLFEDDHNTQIERGIGYQEYKKQNYSIALEHYQIALDHLPPNSNTDLRADIFYKIGRTNLKQQNYNFAIEAFEQALHIQKNGSDQDRAILLNMLGLNYQKVSNIDKARKHLSQALELRYKNKDTLGEAKTLGNLAATYLAQGQYLKAIEYYQKAQQLFSDAENPSAKDLGNILTNLSSVYAEMGQYHKALAIQHQALAIFEKAKIQTGIATSYHNIGYIKSAQLDYPAAVTAFETAISLRQKLDDRFGVAATRNNLGMILSEMGQYEQALIVLLKALPVLEALNTRKQIAATYDSIGSVYTRTGKFSSAFESYHQALLIWRTSGDRDNSRITLGNIGDLLKRFGKNTLAIVFYKQAVNITEAIREELQGLPEQAQKAYLARVEGFYRSLADLLLQQDRVFEAQQVLDLLKIQEAESFLGPVRGNDITVKGVGSLSPEQEISQRYEALQQEAIQIGKELAELSKTKRQDRTDEQNKRYDQLFEREKTLKNAFNDFIDSDEILDLIDQLSRPVRRQMLPLDQLESFRDNLKRLGENVVLLYPLVLEDRLEIILATSLSQPIHVAVPVDQKVLNQTVLDYRTALTRRQDNIQEHAQALYRLLIAPIEKHLKEIGADTILYAPDGILRYIPLAALHDGQQWMVQRFKINNITSYSTSDLETQPVAKPKLLAAAFAKGNFNFNIGEQTFNFSGLPYAALEVNSLSALFPEIDIRLDQQFNPATVIPDLNGYNILHFATHAALVSGKAYESFILFGNGERVTVDQIKRDWILPNVDLVVLSACETALGTVIGKGEEILGLGYLMAKAGAKSTIASLWSVDDGGTQQLMNEFYRILKLSGVTKTEALQKAQIAMIEGDYEAIEIGDRGQKLDAPAAAFTSQNSYSHPYFWAPFILIGNGL